MKVGVEEEFIVVDPDTFWITPGAFQLATRLIFKDGQYLRKCSVELPLHSGSVSTILHRLTEAFCIFELKTDPYEDIDQLREEVTFHRDNLIDCCKDFNLMALPSGLHPGHRSSDFIDNCAAFHVHIDYADGLYDKLSSFIPFFIAVSSNSPFLDGNVKAMTNRMCLSPHVNQPMKHDMLKRNADILYNPTLKTIELKVFDSQITVDEAIGLASMVKALAENETVGLKFSDKEFETKRTKAIKSRLVDYEEFISPDVLDLFKEYNQFSSKKLSVIPGSRWQIEIFQKYGLSSVVSSLYESFIHNKRIIRRSDDILENQSINAKNLGYMLPYFPFFILDKYRKYFQDIKKSGGLSQLN